MTLTVKRHLEHCIEALKQGTLTEEMLRQVIEVGDGEQSKRQSLLYLQSRSTSVAAPVHGMLLVENGQVTEGPANPEDWPYQSVLEAIDDGWRVIQFPNLALLMDESRTYGLGCEFILERVA